MPDEGDGLSSEDLIRQAREGLRPSESSLSGDSVSEDLTDQIRRDLDADTAGATDGGFEPEQFEAIERPSPRPQLEPEPIELTPDFRTRDPVSPGPPETGPVGPAGADSSPDAILLGGDPSTGQGPRVRTRRWPAILALVVGGLFVIGLFVDEGKPATDLAVGDCLLEPSDDEFSTVTVIECAEPHDYEIFALTSLAGGTYPGEFEILDQAYAQCIPLFRPYVGSDYDTSIWYIDVFVPGEALWNEGNRNVRCAVYQPDDSFENITRISGSARNSAE